jgi:putative inorganic carbon (HCO3(-)) transporter
VGLGIAHYIPLVGYIGCLVMCLVGLSGRPRLTFFYLVPLLPYRTLRDHFLDYPLGGNAMTFLVLATIIGALIHGKKLPQSRLYTIWLAFGIFLYFSMWFGFLLGNAPAPLWLNDANFATWKDYMLIPLVFVAGGLTMETRKDIRTLVMVTVITLLAIDKSSLTSSLSRNFTHFDESKRDGGPLGWAGSNGLAAFLAQFSMFFWGLAQFLKKGRYRILCYVLVGMTVFATMYTFSRASYIALVATTFVLGVLKDRKLIPVIILFMFTWQVVVPTAVTERVNMTQSSSGKLESSAQQRVNLWEGAKTTFFHNPIIGTGYATFMYAEHADDLKDTHNWYVKVLTETGLVGFAFAVVLIANMLSLTWGLFKNGNDPLYQGLGLALLLTIIANLILTFFGDRWTYLEINGLLWALMGAATRTVYLAQEKEGAVNSTPVDDAASVNPYLVYR